MLDVKDKSERSNEYHVMKYISKLIIRDCWLIWTYYSVLRTA
jgi:hypothetical protein